MDMYIYKSETKVLSKTSALRLAIYIFGTQKKAALMFSAASSTGSCNPCGHLNGDPRKEM